MSLIYRSNELALRKSKRGLICDRKARPFHFFSTPGCSRTRLSVMVCTHELGNYYFKEHEVLKIIKTECFDPPVLCKDTGEVVAAGTLGDTRRRQPVPPNRCIFYFFFLHAQHRLTRTRGAPGSAFSALPPAP